MITSTIIIMSRVARCLVVCCFITSVCMHGLTDTCACGPFELCSCVTNIFTSFVKIDCSDTKLYLSDVCNYTSNFPNISEVIFSSNNVSFLERKDVSGCEHLEVLVLRNVSLKKVDADVFLNMERLTFLDLSENQLDVYTNSHVRYLANITSLRELKLQGNVKADHLINVSYPELSNLPRLEALYMDGLPNAEFSQDYLQLQNLTNLTLSGLNAGVCDLRELVNSTFDMTPYLKHLNLANCKITRIYAGTFQMLHSLTRLDLSMNEELGFNSMRNISYGLQFTKIDFLNMTKVHTTFGLGIDMKLSDVCYLRNTTLRELVLDSNRLELFETNIPIVLPSSIQILHVRDNRFTFGLYLLQLACLSNLTTIYAGFQNFAHSPLQYLDDPVPCKGTVLVSSGRCIYETPGHMYNLSKTIPGCHYFKTGHISRTDLYRAVFPKTLKNVLFHDSGMKYRILNYPVLPFDNHIENIDLSGNIVYSWIGPIGPFPHLKTLNLSRNYCSNIGPNFFLYLSSVKYLHLEKNFLGIPLADNSSVLIFKPLENIEYLDLSSNQIRYLPSKVFAYLTKLKVLNISSNSINKWTIDVQTLLNLEYIDIQSNSLSELPHFLISHFDEMVTRQHKEFSIDMRNNPIRCSCKYERFLTWMVKHRSSFIGFDQYDFSDDVGDKLTANSFVRQVENFTKTCRSFTLLIILCTMGLTLFISLIICGLIYKNRWKLRYLLYMNKRRFFGYRAIPDYEPINNFRYDAFISYAEEDIRFILDRIIPNLEEKGLGLCIHQRDFIAGNAVTENIINAIQSSKKTVVVLSRAFLKSKWCRYEFQMARMESIYSRNGNSSVIIVMLENMSPNKLMPLEMIEWIKQESYIEYTDDVQGKELFWENLKRGIVH